MCLKSGNKLFCENDSQAFWQSDTLHYVSNYTDLLVAPCTRRTLPLSNKVPNRNEYRTMRELGMWCAASSIYWSHMHTVADCKENSLLLTRTSAFLSFRYNKLQILADREENYNKNTVLLETACYT